MKANDASPVSAKSVVLGTAGHIDHGKTSLVFALTGTDADRLPEEKARGITIDLGFASLDVADAQGSAVHISVIDVPGHHAFIRNMLAGVSGIDCVMLVVAADEGVKPQTTEHLAICNLLGIRQGIVALTKCDLVQAEHLAKTRQGIQELVRGTFLEGAAILPVSSRTGEGMDALKDALAHMAANAGALSRDFVPRLPIDRAFALRGFGTIVTGTLQSGTVQTRDHLELQPEVIPVRVRGIQTHGQSVERAEGPTRVALNLSGVEVGELRRGQTLVPPETLSSTRVVDVELKALPGVTLPAHRSQVRVHAFASETIATVLLYGDPGESGSPRLARLKLREPLLLLPGDRFILRRASPAATIAGGQVLDAAPTPKLRKQVVRPWLERLRTASPAERVMARVERQGIRAISVAELIAETGLTHQALQLLVRGFVDKKTLVVDGPLEKPVHLLAEAALFACFERLLANIVLAGKSPVSRAELSSKLGLDAWVFDRLWARLTSDHRCVVRGQHIGPHGAETAATESSQPLARLEQLYREAGLASPILSEAASSLGLDKKMLWEFTTQLLRSGTLIRLGKDDLLLHADALADLRTKLAKHRGETLDVSRFKELTGLTRKHAIPLLELLDRMRITRNDKGARTVL